MRLSNTFLLIFWVLLQHLLCHLHPRTFQLIGEQVGDPASTYLRNLKIFYQNEVDRFVICAETRIFFNNGLDFINVRFGNFRPGFSSIRSIFDWFLTGAEFCKQPINCGKWHLFIPINNTSRHVCFWHSFLTYSGLLFYTTPDFSNIFYPFSNHFQCSIYDYTWKESILQKNLFADFKYIYRQCTRMISHTLRIAFSWKTDYALFRPMLSIPLRLDNCACLGTCEM